MVLKKGLLALLGIVLFVFILSRADLAQVWQVLLHANLQIYFVCLLLLALTILLKGLKWKALVQCVGEKIGLSDAIKIYLVGLFVGNITPGKVGDFARAWYVKDKVRLPAGLASVFIDRVMDIGMLLALSLFSALWLAQSYGAMPISTDLIVLVTAAFLIAIFFLFKEKYLRAAFRPLFRFMVPESFREKLSSLFTDFFSALKSAGKNMPLFLASLCLGAVLWLLNAVVFYLLAMSLSIILPSEVLLAIFPIMALVDVLPISVSGICTRDAALIFLFSFFAVPAEHAVALSLLVFFTGYLLISLVGLFYFISTNRKMPGAFHE